MADLKKEEQEFLRDEAQEWAEFISKRMLRALARQKKMNLSKLEIYQVHKAVKVSMTNYGAEIGFSFADAGRFIDMKLSSYKGKGSPEEGKDLIATLEDWVESVGVDKFKHVPGYSSGKDIPDERAIKRIALGIFFNRAGGGMTHKRKKWWSHVLYGGLGNLYGRLMFGYGLRAIDSIKQMENKK